MAMGKRDSLIRLQIWNAGLESYRRGPIDLGSSDESAWHSLSVDRMSCPQGLVSPLHKIALSYLVNTLKIIDPSVFSLLLFLLLPIGLQHFAVIDQNKWPNFHNHSVYKCEVLSKPSLISWNEWFKL